MIVDVSLIVVTDHKTMLLEHHILHRDISLGNVMYDGDRRDGDTGRLVDFDLAKLVAPGDIMVRTAGDFRTVRCILAWLHMCDRLIYYLQGTRMYQSFKLFTGAGEDSHDLRPHDCLDDLESFF